MTEISGDAFVEVLRSDGLRVDSELQVFETVKRLARSSQLQLILKISCKHFLIWNFRMAERDGRAAVERFIRYIRFPCMSSEQFALHVVQNSNLLDPKDQIQVFLNFVLPRAA